MILLTIINLQYVNTINRRTIEQCEKVCAKIRLKMNLNIFKIQFGLDTKIVIFHQNIQF